MNLEPLQSGLDNRSDVINQAINSCDSMTSTTPNLQLGSSTKLIQEDPIFELLQQFRQDQRNDKIDLGIGVYRDHLNQSPVFSAVKQAEQWRDTAVEDLPVPPPPE